MVKAASGEEILSQQKAKRIRLLVNEAMAFKRLTYKKVLAMLNENSICAYLINEITVFLKSPNAICNRDFAIGLASVLGFRRTALVILNEPELLDWDNALSITERLAVRVDTSNTSEVVLLALDNMAILRSYLDGASIEAIGFVHGLSQEQVISNCREVLRNLHINCEDKTIVLPKLQRLDEALLHKQTYLKLLNDRLEWYYASLVVEA